MADICPICGGKILRASGNNWVVNDGVLYHKKCPKAKKKLSQQESKDRKLLIDTIADYLVKCPKGYIAESGTLNFMKVSNQIKKLVEDGYNYTDQLYALHEVVKLKNGFWGYTSVVNNIETVMAKKRHMDKIRESMTRPREQDVKFDLAKMLKESDDEW